MSLTQGTSVCIKEVGPCSTHGPNRDFISWYHSLLSSIKFKSLFKLIRSETFPAVPVRVLSWILTRSKSLTDSKSNSHTKQLKTTPSLTIKLGFSARFITKSISFVQATHCKKSWSTSLTYLMRVWRNHFKRDAKLGLQVSKSLQLELPSQQYQQPLLKPLKTEKSKERNFWSRDRSRDWSKKSRKLKRRFQRLRPKPKARRLRLLTRWTYWKSKPTRRSQTLKTRSLSLRKPHMPRPRSTDNKSWSNWTKDVWFLKRSCKTCLPTSKIPKRQFTSRIFNNISKVVSS